MIIMAIIKTTSRNIAPMVSVDNNFFDVEVSSPSISIIVRSSTFFMVKQGLVVPSKFEAGTTCLIMTVEYTIMERDYMNVVAEINRSFR